MLASQLPAVSRDFTNAAGRPPDLFIHVNPILNGRLQSFLLTVLNEELLLLSRQPVWGFILLFFFFFLFLSSSPRRRRRRRTEMQSERNLISVRMPALCSGTSGGSGGFPSFRSSLFFFFPSSTVLEHLKGNAPDCILPRFCS